MKTSLLTLSAAVCGGLLALNLCGADLAEFPEKADWQDSPNLKTLPEDVLEFSKGMVISTEIVKIDPAKKTTLSGEFRTLPGKKAVLFFAFSPMDAEKKGISAVSVNQIPGTATELKAPVGKKDKTLTVADGSKFGKGMVVVFDAKDDFSDLPNDVRSNGWFEKSEKQEDGTWLITLNGVCSYDRPAGTKIRCHASGGDQYIAARSDVSGEKWTTFKGTVTGTAKSGLGGKEWRPGAQYTRVVIFGATEDAPLQFRNVKITEE